MRIRDYLGISERRQRQAALAMEAALVVMFLIGFFEGNTSMMVNTAGGFAVTQIVPLLERDIDVSMDPALTLWITAAIFLHGLGAVGLPGSQVNIYQSIPWWDHLTHSVSASVVAALGYSTVRALDEHSDGIYLPDRFMFVFILLFVLAFGVLWEVAEFAIGGLADEMGSVTILTQYGLEDTLKDLVFNTIGAAIVAIWGTAHLNDFSGRIVERLEARRQP